MCSPYFTRSDKEAVKSGRTFAMATLYLICLSVLLGLVIGAPDNRGTEFVIGFTANYVLKNKPELYVTTSKTTTVNVHVSAPRFPAAGLDTRFTVTAGQVKKIDINNNIRGADTELSTKGILVEADQEVVVYGTNLEVYSNDAYLGFPVDVLGKEYYTVSHHPTTKECNFMVVGVHDRTKVTIQLGSHSSIEVNYNGKMYYKNEIISLKMNRFDTFQAQTYGDLTGSYITSDKVITVFSGNRRTSVLPGTSRDTLVDQMMPVDTWGSKFAIVPTPKRTTGDSVRFIGSEANTAVKIKCSGSFSKSFTVHARTFKVVVTPSNQVCYVESTKPIMVILIVISQTSSSEPADPALITIPPIEQYAADYTFSTPKYSYGEYNNYVMFIVKKAEKSGLKIDGKALPSTVKFTDIPNTIYCGGYATVAPGTHTVRHDSPISVFGAFMYGANRFETYGTPLGLRMSPVNTVCVPTTTVVGDGIDNDCDGLIDEEMCTVENKRKDDDGDGKVEEDCATPPPIDGQWTDWGSWTACSASCSNSGTLSGTRSKVRTCTNPAPKYDGKQCVGSGAITEQCSSSTPCPIDGNWGNWGSWGRCSVTCASGTKSRSRSCNNPAPQHNGAQCSGSSTNSVSCNTGINCPVDGGLSTWSNWGSCSKTCGGGTSARTRACNNPAPAYGGSSCSGALSESKSCNTQACPIDGGFTTWTTWSSCPVTCGSGKLYRSRTCTNPAPQYNGSPCSGASDESKACVLGNCPIDGAFTDWTQWTSCTVTCGTGSSERARTCTDPAPAHGGRDCTGVTDESRSCNTHHCPIDGAFGQWTAWSACGITCGYSTQSRSRQCDSPAPQHGGQDCVGDLTETQQCYGGVMCPIDGGFTTWSSWDSCTVTCAGGTQGRTRTCTNPTPQYLGADCVGHTSETQDCNTFNCPIDGGWTDWTDWSGCSSTCGPGVITRDRTCTNPLPQYNGRGCFGDIQDSLPCNGTCTVHGNWGDWGAWTACTKTCAGGRQGRVRLCDDPAPTPDGNPCVGDAFVLAFCNTGSCTGSGSGSGSGNGTGSGSGSSTSNEAQYVNKCPNGFFTCQSGKITCILNEFRCDCGNDCSDGSDETSDWASCPTQLMAQCGNSAPGMNVQNGLFICVLIATFLTSRLF